MDTVLARLLLRDRQEEDPESGVIRRHETDLIMGLVVYLPVQRVGLEASEIERIVRIAAEGGERRSHTFFIIRVVESRQRTVQSSCLRGSEVRGSLPRPHGDFWT